MKVLLHREEMAAFGSSSMVGDNKIGAKAFLLTMWIGYVLITGAAAIPREELDDMIPALRLRGFNRFGNAIKKSDLMKDCLALNNLTLLHKSMAMAHISGESGLRSHAVSDLILLPSPTILTTLLPSHSLSISVRGARRTVHIAVNGVPLESPGLYHSSHGLAGAVIPLSHFPSCCLPQSPIRATFVQTPSRSAYAGPHAFPQSASSDGDLPYQPDTSIGFSISSTVAALTAAAFAAGVFIHLLRPHLSSGDDDDAAAAEDTPHRRDLLNDDMEGIDVIIGMILTTLTHQGIRAVRVSHEEGVFRVLPEGLGFLLRRFYASRHQILTQPQYARFRTPDDEILVIGLPDGTTLHLGRSLHYFVNTPIYDNAFVVFITAAD